jgi:hypothetical protein
MFGVDVVGKTELPMKQAVPVVACALLFCSCSDRTATTLDSSADVSRPPGTELGPCYGNGTCNSGLTCASGICVKVPDAGQPDLFVPDAFRSDSGKPDIAIPDTHLPDTGQHDGLVPDAKPPDAGQDAGLVPDAPQNNSHALSFSGTNAYVDLGPMIYGSPSPSAITVEAWMKLAASAPDMLVVFNGRNGEWEIAVFGGSLTAGVDLVSGWHHATAPTPASALQGAWHHVAMVWSTGTQVALFVDGLLVANAQTLTGGLLSLSSGYRPTIGAYCAGSGYHEKYFNGLIDEVRVWTVARTQAQIQANMKKALTGMESGLAGYWRLDEGTGTVAHDSSPVVHHGDVYNATWTTDTPF